MSTIPLLPPERSHICIAPGSWLWAQALAGSGVGATAAALGASDAAADAGADAAGTDAAADPPGAVDGVLELQAPTSRMAMIARVGSLRWVLIRTSSNRPGSGRPVSDRRSGTPGLWHSIMSAIGCIHSISRLPEGRT